MAAVLVTLNTAKQHLGIPITDVADTDRDADIQLKLDQAEARILRYLATAAAPLWVSPATAPGSVTSAILLWLGALRRTTGDDEGADAEQAAKTWGAITIILADYHMPALA